MDNRRHLKDPSIKKADFMDGDGFSVVHRNGGFRGWKAEFMAEVAGE